MHRPGHIPGFDGLRALACLGVFAVHLQQLTLTQGRPPIRGRAGVVDWGRLAENGNTGVCLFFMLSGFLLSLPFWLSPAHTGIDHTQRGSRWLIGFTGRRLARIVPAYFICLNILVLMGKASGPADVMLHYAFAHNFNEKYIYSISDPFWTIAVQAQFYIVFAFLMLPLAPMARHRLLVAVVLIIAIVACFVIHSNLFTSATKGMLQSQGPKSVLRISTLAHLPHFLLGMLAALLFAVTQRPAMVSRLDEEQSRGSMGCDLAVLLCAGGMFAILAVPALDQWFRIPMQASDMRMIGRYNFPYIPLLIAVILVLLPRTRWLAPLLELAPVRYIGLISYGLYVFHLPCLEICKGLLTDGRAYAKVNTYSLALLGLGSVLVVASVSYWLVERPLLRWSKRQK